MALDGRSLRSENLGMSRLRCTCWLLDAAILVLLQVDPTRPTAPLFVLVGGAALVLSIFPPARDDARPKDRH